MKLQKVFKNKNRDAYGFTNDITIFCDYDPQERSIDNIQAKCWNARKADLTDLTSIFMEEPFYSIIDGIDWEEIYREKKEAENE